jgi:hypothetical protein
VAGSPGYSVGAGFDPTIANVARVYDYMLGGKDNFAVDRELADQLLSAFPESAWIARQNREFAGRAVSYCAEQGVSQFLDIGSGLPTMSNVHEVARAVVPGARVVYVDNDKVAHSHAEAMLTTSDGVAAILGDVRAPEQILADIRARRLLDLGKPFVVMMTAILHFITDEEKPEELVAVFKNAMPAGSFLVLTHATHDWQPEESERATRMYKRASAPLVTRSRIDIAALFRGLELVPPGLVRTSRWRPAEESTAEFSDLFGGVGRKP